MKARAFVVAHHHPRGEVAADLRALVRYLAALPARVVFVSTNLSPEARAALPAGVEVITRENVGYDFYSYKVGIEALGDCAALEQLAILNSSFACLDAAKLCERFFSRSRPGVDILGITASGEIAPHVQSYFVSFEGRRVLGSPAFREWWAAMTPVSERERVIAQYEIGMSRHFHGNGFVLGAAFVPSPEQNGMALARWREFLARHPGMRDRAAHELNPTHFLWDALLEEFGIVKLEVVVKNPYGMDLGGLPALEALRP
jgi:rhamnosyltransferase